MAERILVVDDEASMRRMLEILFREEGYEVVTADSAEAALQALARKPFDLVLSDIRMPGLSGLDLLRRLKEEESSTEVVLMTAYASTESAIEALKLGAFDYITKPFQVEELSNIVRHAFEKRRLAEENVLLREELARQERLGGMVAANPRMKQLFALIERVAPTPSTVLIQGESGTGKELVARTIHQRSPRSRRPFVAVNCGGIPETLLESELFGHVKGAFTGAHATKRGLFDTAQGGTLFLDEIAEMSPAMQVKLLRALQERSVRPVGGDEEHAVDVRVLAATNQDLPRLIQERRFREDLYYRLAVITLALPPLRERREDIPLLCRHFLEKHARLQGREAPGLSGEALKRLEAYPWPGNVRELENCMERAVALCEGNVVELRHLPETLRGPRPLADPSGIDIPPSGFSLNDTLESIRAAYIRKALEEEGLNMTRAAARLGITFRSMRYFVKKYGLNAKEG
ncbi:MAG: sigma-54-dependent transcriptional regulator [Acidobacteriota bacterium]